MSINMESADGFKCVRCGREGLEVVWLGYLLTGRVSLCIDCYEILDHPVTAHDIIKGNYEWLKNIIPYN